MLETTPNGHTNGAASGAGSNGHAAQDAHGNGAHPNGTGTETAERTFLPLVPRSSAKLGM